MIPFTFFFSICSTCDFICPLLAFVWPLLVEGSSSNERRQKKLLQRTRWVEFSSIYSNDHVCVVQLKSKWSSLSWKTKKRWTAFRRMARPVPLQTADRTGPSDTARTTTPPCSKLTTDHGTMWRPPFVMSKIWKTDSEQRKSYVYIHWPENMINCPL